MARKQVSKQTAARVPAPAVDGLSILESDALKRLIREEIRANQVPLWKQFTNWQLYLGASAVIAIFFGIFSSDELTQPVVDRVNRLLKTQNLIDESATMITREASRTAYFVREAAGDEIEYKSDGTDCDKS
jgi:hypothetical protein